MAGTPIDSEILALDAAKAGIASTKKFAIAYQNVRQPEIVDIIAIIRETITVYGP